MKPAQIFALSLTLLLLPASSLFAMDATENQAYRYGALGRSHEMTDENDTAMDYFNKSLDLKPDTIIYSDRGDLKKKIGDLAGAIADYDKAIALNDSYTQSNLDLSILYSNRALMRHQAGDLPGAIADYTFVINLHPDSAVFYNNRAYAKLTLGDLTAAATDYAKAVELEPSNADYREHLAYAKRDQGDFAGALADYDKLAALIQNRPLTFFDRGNIRQLQGDFAGAIKDYETVIKLVPESWGGYLHRGTVLQSQNKLDAALADYDKALSVSKEPLVFAAAYREIVLRLLKRGSTNAEFAKIGEKAKDGFSKSIILYLSGNLSEADFLAGGKSASGKSITAYFAGMNRLLAGDNEGARTFFEQSLAAKGYDAIEFVLAKSELARLPKKP